MEHAAKAMHTGKFITLNTCIGKVKKMKISDITIQLNKLGIEQQINSKKTKEMMSSG